MKFITVCLVLLGGLLFTSGNRFANTDLIEIRILPESIVYQERYTLGEIAELDGFDVETIQELAKVKIGVSPIPGKSHFISKYQIFSRIKNKFRNHQFNINIPPKAIVSRASLKIPREQIKQIIESEISKQYHQYADIKITIKTKLNDIFIPKGKASYEVKRVAKTGLIGGYNSWMLNFKLNGKPAKKLIVRAKVDVFEDVTVAKGNIEKGTLVQKSDITVVKKNISKERFNYQPKANLVVGKQARRDIFKNEAMKSHLVELPVIMQKGTPVKVIYQTKNLKLTNIAKAMKSGRKGDIIPVKTLNGKVTIYAVIIDSKNVEVVL